MPILGFAPLEAVPAVFEIGVVLLVAVALGAQPSPAPAATTG